MLRIALAGLRAHLFRLLLTALAITLGVAFVAATFVLTDTMQAGFDRQFTASANKVTAAVLPKEPGRKLPASLLGTVRGVSGVRAAHGEVRGPAPLLGKDGRAYGSQATLGLSIADGPLQRYEVTRGRAPRAPSEAVLSETVARRAGFTVGDTVKVLDAMGAPHAFTVVGVLDFGVDREIAFRGAVGFTEPVAMRMTGERGYVEIDTVGAAGLPDGIAAAVGPSYEVVSSTRLAKELGDRAGVDTTQAALGFLAFAVVALFVAALVIYNTFNILIAQRMREMALLRCVGATRAQVFRGVLLESAVVGLAASALGVAGGIGLGYAAAALFDSGTGMTGGALVVTATPIVAGLVLGLLVTVGAALLPARAATRVPPVAALRVQAEGPVRSRAGVVRIVSGSLLAAAGLGVTGLALAGDKGPTGLLTSMAGASLIFFGTVALSPMIVRALSGFLGKLPARLGGVPGRLAMENSRRNPKRSAVTTIALTVGVTLMTMFSVAFSSVQATTEAMLGDRFPVDYLVQAQFNSGHRVPRSVTEHLRRTRLFSAVIELRRATATVNGGKREVGAVSRRYLDGTLKPKVSAGSVADLRPGAMLLNDQTSRLLGAGVGETVSVGSARLRVAAVLTGETPMPGIVLDESDFTRLFATGDPRAREPVQVYLIAAKGASADATRAAVDRATRPYPTIQVNSVADIKATFTSALDRLFVVVAGLLALAIIISLVGIANTLTLSVVERARESALLRALGMTGRGLRRMLALEALIISVIGALIGVVLGTGFGWAALGAAFADVELGFPTLRIVVFMVVAALAGVLAAVLPGRRAARASIVESLAAE